jgi:hypothetical protein
MPADAAARRDTNRTVASRRQRPVVRDPLKTSARADPVTAFREWCAIRASVYAAGECDLLEAVDALQEGAVKLGLVETLGQDRVQAEIAAAFEPMRADLLAADDPAADPEPDRFTRDRYRLTRVMRETADHLLRTKNLSELRRWLTFLSERDVQIVRTYMQQRQRGTP